jgi:hypothetical protein
MSWISSLLAGFQVIMIGRVWVIPEVNIWDDEAHLINVLV